MTMAITTGLSEQPGKQILVNLMAMGHNDYCEF